MTRHTQVFRVLALFVLLGLGLLNNSWMSTVEATSYSISGRVTDGDDNPIEGVTITAELEMQHRVFLPMVMCGLAEGVSHEADTRTESLVGRESRVAASLEEEISTDEHGLSQRNQGIWTVGALTLATYTAITDANGNYILNGLPAGTYTLVPSLDEQSFSPESLTVTVPPDATNQDFQTGHPPYVPSAPTPADGAVDQSIDVNLSWTGGDPDGDGVTYDVYLKADDPTPDELICDDAPSASCDPGTLSYSTDYYWYVIAQDEHGVTSTGAVWHFATEGLPLFESVLYLPEDSSAAVAPDSESLDLGIGFDDDFTVEMFFYVPDLGYDGNDLLAKKEDSFELAVLFRSATPDYILFTLTILPQPPPLDDLEVELSCQLDIPTGWHHVAAVFDNEYTETEDAFTIFLDGVRIAHSPEEDIHVDWSPGLPNSWRSLEIGYGFPSYLDEARISGVARYSSPTYSIPVDPFSLDGDTRALWHFDEPAGSTLFGDASSNGNDLTGYNGAQTYRP